MDPYPPSLYVEHTSDMVLPTFGSRRVERDIEERSQRTRVRAEVYTPSWLCRLQNNLADDWWFGATNAFNLKGRVSFENGRSWWDYLASRRIELTCGEAPYLTGVYDVVTGGEIAPRLRSGLLDRKLRVIEENARGYKEWVRAIILAFSSLYGFDISVNNVVCARQNLYSAFRQAYRRRFGGDPPSPLANVVARIIARNIFLMDGVTYKVPGTDSLAVIKDWVSDRDEYFVDIVTQRRAFFDIAVANPPYQDDKPNTSSPALYPRFLDLGYDVATYSCCVTPLRFIYGSGKVDAQWVQAFTHDPHTSIRYINASSTKVFEGVNIAGGIAVFDRCRTRIGEPIGQGILHPVARAIVDKVRSQTGEYLPSIMHSSAIFRLSPQFHEDYPHAKEALSKGHENDLVTNIFTKLDDVLRQEPRDGDIRIIGSLKKKRAVRYISRKHICPTPSIDRYNIAVPKMREGEVLGFSNSPQVVIGEPVLLEPGDIHTQTFVSIGDFETREEAERALMYVRSRFARCLLASVKVTQDCNVRTWVNVPHINNICDLNHHTSIETFDWQLCEKYGLTSSEYAFIVDNIQPI